MIEKGAEVFAAEFIYPEAEFAAFVAKFGVTDWQPENIICLKRMIQAKVSYTFVRKRLERLGHIERGVFAAVRWKKLEEEIFGVPYWKERARRARMMSLSPPPFAGMQRSPFFAQKKGRD